MRPTTRNTDEWLTPGSLAALRDAADDTTPDAGDRLRALARRLCADVRSRDGTASDVVVAVKTAWASTPRSARPLASHDAERLSRLVSLCIDEYYGVRR